MGRGGRDARQRADLGRERAVGEPSAGIGRTAQSAVAGVATREVRVSVPSLRRNGTMAAGQGRQAGRLQLVGEPALNAEMEQFTSGPSA